MSNSRHSSKLRENETNQQKCSTYTHAAAHVTTRHKLKVNSCAHAYKMNVDVVVKKEMKQDRDEIQ